MKEIKLPCGRVTFVDDEDYKLCTQLKLYSEVQKNTTYVRVFHRWEKGDHVYFKKLHRLIMAIDDKIIDVDHKDGNGLNNSRSNLRVCNHSDNIKNRSPRGTSKYMGVSRHLGKYWLAKININGKQIHIGSFQSEIDAAIAYNKAAIATGNNFYRLNDI
jgi:hypothetical protein